LKKSAVNDTEVQNTEQEANSLKNVDPEMGSRYLKVMQDKEQL